MATLFGADATSVSDIQNPVTVKRPVQDDSSVIMASGINNLAQSLFGGPSNKGGGIIGDWVSGVKEGRKNAALNDYRNSAMGIARAVDQGKISLSTGNTKMRQLWSKYSTAAPALMDDFKKINDTVNEGFGFKETENRASYELSRQRDLETKAYDNGYGEDVDGYLESQRYTKQLELDIKEANRRSAMVAADNAESKQNADVAKSKVEESFANWADSQLPTLEKRIRDIINDPNKDSAQKLFELEAMQTDLYLGKDAGMRGNLHVLGETQVENILRPHISMIELGKKMADGKIELETLNTQLDTLKKNSKLNLFKDVRGLSEVEALKDVVGESNLTTVVGNGTISEILRKSSEYVGAQIRGTQEPKPMDILSKEPAEKKLVFETLPKAMKDVRLMEDGPDKERREQAIEGSIKYMLNSLGKFGGVADEAVDWKEWVGFVASDEFKNFYERRGLTLNENEKQKLTDAFQTTYVQDVVGAVENEVEKHEAFQKGDIKLKMEGGTAVFYADTQAQANRFEQDTSAGMDVFGRAGEISEEKTKQYNDSIKNSLRSLNNKVAPIINDLIKAESHMNLSSNYKEVFDKNFSAILNPYGAQQETTDQTTTQETTADTKNPEQPAYKEGADKIGTSVEEGLKQLQEEETALDLQPEVVEKGLKLTDIADKEEIPPEGEEEGDILQELRIDIDPDFDEETGEPLPEGVLPKDAPRAKIAAWQAPEAEAGDFKELVNVVSAAEGTDKGEDYNTVLAYGQFGGKGADLVNMTLDEIDDLQTEMLNHPDNKFNSSAIGKFQITKQNLDFYRKKLGLSGDEKFTKELQDRLFTELLEKRGLSKYLAGNMTRAAFTKGLMNEWAGLSKTDANKIANLAKKTEQADNRITLLGDNAAPVKYQGKKYNKKDTVGSLKDRSLGAYLMMRSNKPASHIEGLNASFADSLARMFEAAPDDIKAELGIYSGYRSVAHQRRLWQNKLKEVGGNASLARKWVAPPGRSRHNYGNAVDLSYNGVSLARAPAKVVKWVHANAGKYGLRFPMSWEPWHIEPKGARGK